MTDIALAPGLTLAAYDLDGLNAFLKTEDARNAGVVIALSGQLTPGNTDVAILSGQPIGEAVVKSIDGRLVRAAVVRMSPYFDLRHAQFFAAGVMRAVANARQLAAMDQAAVEALEYDEVPSGDILLVKTAMVELARNIDGVLDYPLLGIRADAA